MLGRLKSRRAAPAPVLTDVERRHQRFLELRADAPADVWLQRSAPAADGLLPEHTPSQLDAELVRREVATAGAVLVRGLLPPAQVTVLRDRAELVLQGLERVGPGGDSGDDWYRPFAGGSETPELPLSRQIATLSNYGALLVDSPRFAGEYLSVLRESGMVDLVSGYLGAPAMLSAEKSVVRRVPAQTGTNWHQDGAFLGQDVRALNVWVALSDCGADAPGLDLVAARPDHILPVGTGDALFDWSIGQEAVDEWRGALPIVHPDIRAGDAVLFDHMLVHRTGVLPGMTKTRYALESWFFTPWHFPAGYTGIAAGDG